MRALSTRIGAISGGVALLYLGLAILANWLASRYRTAVVPQWSSTVAAFCPRVRRQSISPS
jgi:predicted benzoate:H+ symporter BenE